jgi:8-oxo-dGTP diphosphatase
MAGSWEFPGGKIADGETALDALKREFREEIGIEVLSAQPLIRYRHLYADRAVVLNVWTVTRHAGEPRALEGQPLRWEAVDRLLDAGLLEADRPIVELLRVNKVPKNSEKMPQLFSPRRK